MGPLLLHPEHYALLISPAWSFDGPAGILELASLKHATVSLLSYHHHMRLTRIRAGSAHSLSLRFAPRLPLLLDSGIILKGTNHCRR